MVDKDRIYHNFVKKQMKVIIIKGFFMLSCINSDRIKT